MLGTQHRNKGFTLIELLVVVSIIAVLTSVLSPNIRDAWERSQATTAVQQMRQVHTAVSQYIIDTGTLPPTCMQSCTAANDPLANNVAGVPGWNGPYIRLNNMQHPWGGSYSIRTLDVFGDGSMDLIVYLDDDNINISGNDDSGLIPLEVLEMIDEMVDDGNLADGNFVGHAQEGSHLPEYHPDPSYQAISTQFEGIWIFELNLD